MTKLLVAHAMLACLAVSAHTHAQAQAATAPPPEPAASAAPITIVAPASDKNNYLSDRITFQFATFVRRIDMTTEQKTAAAGCAPAGTSFKGIGTGQVNGTGGASPLFIITFVPTVEVENKRSAGLSRCTNEAIRVKEGDVVLVQQNDIRVTPPDRFGLTYGTLLVPFKYHFRGDKDFTGGASLGGYLGFRQDRSGVTGLALQYVGFLGAANVAVPQTVNGVSTTQNMTGVSYGLGIIGTVKDAFHMGVVIGADRVNSSANFKDNGKAWLAISVGFDFSN